jgi:hypothetical protein
MKLSAFISGKTGGRWLIAKHRAVDVLRRLHARQDDIKGVGFEEVLKTRHPQLQPSCGCEALEFRDLRL